MSLRRYVIALTLIVALAAALLWQTDPSDDNRLDAGAVNDLYKTIDADPDGYVSGARALPAAPYRYALFDSNGQLLASTDASRFTDFNAAVVHRDTLLPLQNNGTLAIYNEQAAQFSAYRRHVATGLLVGLLALYLLGLLLLYRLDRRVLNPFRKLQTFATDVAAGDFSTALTMERDNTFGAFTESFDLMRAELAAAKETEQRVNQSKKELVASLSHDIKTPVASIRAVAELMSLQTDDDKLKQQLTTIESKADQINLLINNLFHATMEDMEQLTVTPVATDSADLLRLLQQADSTGTALLPALPPCTVMADALRLAQVFDNIFANAVKYAGTPVDVTCADNVDALTLTLADRGGGVSPEQLPLLVKKFYRGSNAVGRQGSGLGLYLSQHFMQRMGGDLTVTNTPTGLAVTVILSKAEI